MTTTTAWHAHSVNWNRFAIAAGAVFAFTFLFDWIAHGMLMKPLYMATSEQWRSVEEMGNYLGWTVMHQILLSCAFVFLFTRNYEAKGWREGLRFGMWVGIIFAIMQSASYSWMPIPMSIPLGWAALQLVHAVGSGIIAAWLYRKA